MKFCIIEDDSYKMKDLTEWVQNFYATAEIDKAESFRSGSLAVYQNNYDLIILDMQLKLYNKSENALDSDKMAIYGGERIMRSLERSNIAAKVVVVTQYTTFSEKLDEQNFDTLTKRLAESCPNVFKGAIQYSFGDSTWKKELFTLTQLILK